MTSRPLNRRCVLAACAGLVLSAGFLPQRADAAARTPKNTVRYYHTESVDKEEGLTFDGLIGVDERGKTVYAQVAVFPIDNPSGVLAVYSGEQTVTKQHLNGRDFLLQMDKVLGDETFPDSGSFFITLFGRFVLTNLFIEGFYNDQHDGKQIGVLSSAYAKLAGTWAGPFPLGGVLTVTLDKKTGLFTASIVAGKTPLLQLTGRFTPVKTKFEGENDEASSAIVILPETVVNNIPPIEGAFSVHMPRLFTYVLEGNTLKLGIGAILGQSTFVTLTRQK